MRCARAFFATLECELLDRVTLRTPAEARAAVFDFIEGWYIRVVARMIEEHSEGPLTLLRLANESGLSLYHFLRVFQQITGVTPHQ